MPRRKDSQTPLTAQDPVEIAFIQPPAADEVEIPEQRQHFELPVRFGAVPVDKAPLGWEVETRRPEYKVTKFQHAYPTIRLPFQEVQRVAFGHNDEFLKENAENPKLAELFPTGANRLFFGDNLHIMRQLPSNSIDLIYIDPPFFSGRNYNVIFGDKNEVRSFSDIWESGMPGYLVWLNVRLFEMKRLLKPSGSIYVHLDWHASHYVKVEMDKVFGYDRFLAEIVWHKNSGGIGRTSFSKRHDVLLQYAKGDDYFYDGKAVGDLREKEKGTFGGYFGIDDDGREYREVRKAGKVYKYYMDEPRNPEDVWEVAQIPERDKLERVGYPTQKPIELLQRIVDSSCPPGGVVADFFAGGGTTCVVASGARIERETISKQKRDGTTEEFVKRALKFDAPARRWIASDQSRIAISITADRVARVIEEGVGRLFTVPDFSVEHWGIYEAPKLEQYGVEQFKEFVVRAFGGKPEHVSPAIHGVRHGIPLFVGAPSRGSRIGKDDVARFAKAVYEERRANHGVMLGWNFGPDARKAAEILAARENKRIDFVRLNLIRLESDEFREHVVNRHKDYGPLLSFIQPPEVRVAVGRVAPLTYEFDVSDSVSLNRDGVIANVQWDFNHKPGKFTSTQGYTFLREKKTGRPVLVVEYTFPTAGTYDIACSVQDDQGGERTVIQTIDVH
jgi:DNA modification methylase